MEKIIIESRIPFTNLYIRTKEFMANNNSLVRTSAIYNGNVKITHDYAFVKYLCDDIFIVGVENTENQEKSIVEGVISITRNAQGIIYPSQEEVIVPLKYVDVRSGGEKTVIVSDYDNLGELVSTYYDVDALSPNFKQQLFPLKLTVAAPFGLVISGFAQCKTKDMDCLGFLSRASIKKDNMSSLDLLTTTQVERILPIIKMYEEDALFVESALKKIENQTNGTMVLKRIKKDD